MLSASRSDGLRLYREATPAYVEQARAFLAERIPGLADARLSGSRACLYENTPDHDFVVDWVPGSQRIQPDPERPPQ